MVYIVKANKTVKQQLFYGQDDYDQFKREARIAMMRWKSKILQERHNALVAANVSASLRNIHDEAAAAVAI